MSCLRSHGLEKRFSLQLYKKFEELALKYYKLGNAYGVERLWSLHIYTQQRNVALPVQLDPALEKIMVADEKVGL